ncbi:GNAT family N-acetyltransferase [Nocardia arizonensis]|uniref:GNAT family N-acetyltransferase n=1 Tax=Nocardia arizonensis TaxID=1141647 RepID=UPI0006D2A53F|nr:GNAT family N-acetyltransferase [Nocardia arizonensis]
MLRKARLDDLATISVLEHDLFADLAYSYVVLRQLYDLHGAHWVVAEVDRIVRGYALVGLDTQRCAWVMGLGVDAAYSGHGIGRELLESAVENCRLAHAERVKLTVRPGHDAAASLYTKVGFTVISKEDHYFGLGEPRHVLERELEREPRGLPGPDDPHWIKRPRGPRP